MIEVHDFTLQNRFGYIRDEKTRTVSTSHTIKLKNQQLLQNWSKIATVYMYISAIEKIHRMGGM